MKSPLQVAAPPVSRPLMIYDGDCAFCVRWIKRWRRLVGGSVDFAASAEVAGRFPEIPSSLFSEAVLLVEVSGRVSMGAEAAARSLAYRRGLGWPLWLYQRVPGCARLCEAMYRFVARHRGSCSVPS